ncbi:S1 RNA-binding domain-containing protein, partial [candidate division WOR-3 bacterium]|nr:S1 RNA-binding domain-containing protein [candidate division WOR-3 bacterium]MBD3365466.1 S1 RNA-binding domain-containing protein [candidate division WOR-3 bacterium]
GKVTSFTDYGAFVELEKGIEGLIHVSEMSWTRVVNHPAQILQIGQEVEAIVLSLDKENRRISLGLKQTTPDPWSVIDERYHIGQRLEGTVSSLKNFGAFVELEEGIEGLIRNVDLSWTKRVKHPREILKRGEKIGTIILDIDKESRRITLGLKQTHEDPFYMWSKEYRQGQHVAGKIIDMPSSGVVVALTDEIEGFIPQQQLRKRKIKKIKDHYDLGDELQLIIRRIDPKSRRVILSERDYYQKTVEKGHRPAKPIKAPKGFALKDHLEDALSTLKDATTEEGQTELALDESEEKPKKTAEKKKTHLKAEKDDKSEAKVKVDAETKADDEAKAESKTKTKSTKKTTAKKKTKEETKEKSEEKVKEGDEKKAEEKAKKPKKSTRKTKAKKDDKADVKDDEEAKADDEAKAESKTKKATSKKTTKKSTTKAKKDKAEDDTKAEDKGKAESKTKRKTTRKKKTTEEKQ